ERLATALRQAVEVLAEQVGGRDRVPSGWWGIMDAALRPIRPPQLTWRPDPPYLRVRRERTSLRAASPGSHEVDGARFADGRPGLATRISRALTASFVEPLQPFDGYAPGAPDRAVLEAVRDAGFRYAFTKAALGPRCRVVGGVEGLTVM